MAIPFNTIPNTLRVPFTYVEISNENAQQGAALQKYTSLVIGQKLSAGSVSSLVPTVITSEAQAREAFGEGSMLHGMLSTYLANDKVTELVAIAQDDDGSAVKATGKITIATGTATETGVLAVYIAGVKVAVVVDSGDDQDAVATALAAAIQAEGSLYVSAAVNGTNANEVDVTAKNGGEAGNDIDLRLNYATADKFPAGITASVTAMASGATNPDFDDVLAVLPDVQYNVIVHAMLDSANLTKFETEMDDRFGPIRQLDGVGFSAKKDTLANLTTLGNSRNSRYNSIMGVNGPSASWEWAAAYGAQVANSSQIDPARPFQTLQLKGVLAPSSSEEFLLAERNNLLFDGIATFRVEGGVPIIERAITTFQTNNAGAVDSSYLDVNTLMTLSYLRFSFRNRMLSKFSRHKLASDGDNRFGAGQKILTPRGGRAEAVALFAEWENLGLVEGLDQFKRDLIVERNAADANRLDFLLPPDLVNQLRVVAAKIEFLI